ncbi:MAG: LPS assembly lipoprotein LptE [candidate division Zixibacteria bacterium]|nr:LPS assembly lipoprotein LptE [candidate division Zixibacteria bacterium]
MKTIKYILFSVLLLMFSCGPYSFHGTSLPGVNSIAIPSFENQTAEYGLSESITEKLVDGFVQNHVLKVLNQKEADAILYGTITKYQRRAYTYDEQENIKEYISEIYVKVWLEDKNKKRNLWEENMKGWGVYSVTEEETQGKERAVEKLVEDIINRTVKSW